MQNIYFTCNGRAKARSKRKNGVNDPYFFNGNSNLEHVKSYVR